MKISWLEIILPSSSSQPNGFVIFNGQLFIFRGISAESQFDHWNAYYEEYIVPKGWPTVDLTKMAKVVSPVYLFGIADESSNVKQLTIDEYEYHSTSEFNDMFQFQD